MSQIAIPHPSLPLEQSQASMRRRLYGLAIIVSLSFLLLARTNDSQECAAMYLPLVGPSMLMLCLAGAEFTLYLQRLTLERRSEEAKHELDEQQALERQRSFNHIWQDLADSRGSSAVPAEVLKELDGLFKADLVAVWAGDKAGGFHLAGAHPVANEGAVRLDKVAQMSPCFEKLRETQELLRVSNFEQDTSKAFAWFCEENEFRHVILCPVLVRRDLVGVLAFFYHEKRAFSSRRGEEMQAAANLFLCAF
jgi:transcriptional regulator with GAF, ATPase, and Fis domain